MRAKTIHEEEFTRGGDPYKKMNLGTYDEDWVPEHAETDDVIELQEDMYYFDTLTRCVIASKVANRLRYEKGRMFRHQITHSTRPVWYEINKEPYVDEPALFDHPWVIKYFQAFKKMRGPIESLRKQNKFPSA